MKNIALIVCVLLLPSISYSIVTTPSPLVNSVSGTFNHGNFINISGSGFGTKSPAKPKVWADFEDGSVSANSSLSSGTLTTDQDGTDYVISTEVLPHSRSAKAVKGMAKTNGVKTASALRAYISSDRFYYFVRRKWPSGTFRAVANLKVFFGEPTDGYIGLIMNYHNFGVPFNPAYANQGMATVHQFGTGIGEYTILTDGYWTTWEYQEKKSDIDVYNGKLKWWVDGTLKRNSTNILSTTTKYPASVFNKLTMSNFWTVSSDGVATYPDNSPDYLDDLYMDDTWARVMIGNASTFDACTHREPLIPTAWSSTFITAYFNQGSFPNGSKVYLFVIDSDGNASPGKEIAIGGTASGGDSLNPNPPVNLSIK